MTRSTPPPTTPPATRRSARGSMPLNDIQKSKVVISKKNIKSKKNSKNIKKAIQYSSDSVKVSISGIHDFKKQFGSTMYLVSREGYMYDSWLTESAIENLDVVAEYQQKVLADTGYSITEQFASNSDNIALDQSDNREMPDLSNKRPSRISKTRAAMALKQPEFMDQDEQDDSLGKKRKSVASVSDGGKKRSAGGGSGRKTKAQALLEKQQDNRLKRSRERENKDGNSIIRSMDHAQGKDCCLKCASNTYRQLLEKGDLEGFKRCFEDTRNIPHHHQEDIPNGLHLIPYAIVLEKFDFAEFASKFKPSTNEPRPDVPVKYVLYDDNTGHNRRGGVYGNRTFRQVQESRGNRLGNSAFYGKRVGSVPRKSYMNVEEVMRETDLSAYMPLINTDIFKKPEVIQNFMNMERNSPIKMYYTIAAGSRMLASKLMDDNVEAYGRNIFNHLHQEVLKFDGTQALTSYRKTQILKMAFDASNVTPYHCSAINSSAVYLSEFFETLDHAERLETDSYGRSVAFFAAVSETTDCLEYLISKQFNMTQHDKFKLTPLIQAARYGRSANVELLIKHLRGDETEAHVSIFLSLLRNRRTAMHYAAFFGHAETCRVLIQNNCPVDSVENLDKQTPLHFAAKNGYLDCVRVLIEEGHADPEKGDKFDRKALHLACIYGHLDIVYYLLSIGVDADSPDSSHNYPTHYAAAYGYMNILHLLIEFGSADPTLPNVWTSTPCSVANMKGHIAIVKYLLELPGSPINVNFKDQDGLIMLHHTIDEPVVSDLDMELNLNKAKLLLSMNSDVNSKDLEGCTPLHHLAANTTYHTLHPKNYTSIYPEKVMGYVYQDISNIQGPSEDDMNGILYQLDMAKLLIDHGADLHAVNSKNETPLATAMRNKNHYLVVELIKVGARFWIDKDEGGNTFFHYYATLAAHVNSIRPHGFEENEVRKQRFTKVIENIWQAAEAVIKEKRLDLSEIANEPNDKGYACFVWGVYKAISAEKSTMASEKRLISTAVTGTPSRSYGFGGYSSSSSVNWLNRKKVLEYPGILDFDLRFDFGFFITCMQNILSVCKPNLDQQVMLPKDFKKNKPNAKRTDYPVLTGYAALHFACQTQCIDLIEFVLHHGGSPNIRVQMDDWLGDTPMHMACHAKKDKKQELPNESIETIELLNKKFSVIKPSFEDMLYESINLLLRYQACPFTANSEGTSSLFKASAGLNEAIVRIMCNATPSLGTDINIKNDKNQTALTVALDMCIASIRSKKGIDLSVIQSLLLKNADPNALYEDGDTVFMKAIKTSHLFLIKVILENSVFAIDHNCKNKNLKTALNIACELNNSDVLTVYWEHLKQNTGLVKQTINSFDSRGRTPLSYACQNGNTALIEVLLDHLSADPNVYSPQHVPLCEAVKSGNIESVKTILEFGVNIEQYDENRNTALHNAVLVEKHHIVDLLLSYSADCRLVNSKLQTPLHLAIDVAKKQTNRSFRVERSLLLHGADINAVDFLNRTPLHYVFVDSNTIPLTRETTILQKKVKLISKEMQEEKNKQDKLTAYVTQFDLNQHPNNSHLVQVNDWLKNGKLARLNQKLEKKKSNNVDQDLVMTDQEKDETRVYHSYKWEAENDIPERFDPIDIFKFLLLYTELAFDPLDKFGRSPLHYAACVGAFSCSTMLIAKGIDMNIVDSDNNNALQLALRNNYIDFSVMLCNLGASVKLNMTLRNGTVISTLGYSLSKSLINVAYMIMDQGSLLIESIKDSLKNGKFQMVELLLNSADDKILEESTTDAGQNMWHILADFKPFNREIWLDYIDEFISKVKNANPPFTKDNFGRTPLHYAAMHGQDLLLQRLTQINTIGINDYDVDGKSELDYAVEACQIDCLKILLGAGASVIKSSTLPRTNKSLLLLAVEKGQYEIAELLIEHTALTDDGDSAHGRPTCIMTACQRKDLKMLKILVNCNANPNTPCYIERLDKHGTTCKVLVHPMFIASQISDERFLETLLEAGADPNVYGPTSEPEKGQSCFMYNVALKHIKHQEILLKYKVDLNATDPTTNRSIFYQFFFGIAVSQSSNYVGKTGLFYSFDKNIFEKMLRGTPDSLEVNRVDAFTNMTPLEFAIRDKKPLLITFLLQFGANPNIESCANSTVTSFAQVANPHNTKLPGILHAILQNNLEVLDLLFKESQHKIDMEWQDDEKNSVLSYMLGVVSGYSASSSTVMECVFSHISSPVFKKLLRLKNTQGMSPLVYAYHRQDKILYNRLIVKDFSATKFATDNYRKEDFLADNVYSPMQVDHISLDQVDHDAQIERKKLQALKDLEKAQDKTAIEQDDKLQIDSYAKLSKVGALALDEKDQPYDIMLMKVELNSWGANTDTSFYKLSVIFNKVLGVYILWTRWGPFGQEGQHQKTPFLTMEEAVAEFESIFKSKTGNTWVDHPTSFEIKPGKYEIMEIAHHPKDTIIKNFDFLATPVPSDLTKEISNVMKLICNYTYLSKVYSDTHIDMPLGQIPQNRIEDARALLNETNELIKAYNELRTSYSDRAKILQSKVYAFKIAQKCVAYSRLLPRHGEANQAIRSLYNHQNDVIPSELSKLADLSYVGFAANVVLAAKHHVESVNPLDYAFRALNCSLRPMSPSNDLNEYQLVTKYMNSTAKSKFELVHLFAVNRADEKAKFRPYEKSSDRKLLWHGSRVGNFMGILKQGLRVSPRTSSANGALLGNGVYFADTFSKSLNYSTENFENHRSAYKLMLLCEVSLGNEKLYGDKTVDNTQTFNSMKGQGMNIPDPENTVYDESGLCIPIGPCIPFVQPVDTQPNSYKPQVNLNFNEWAVYNEDRVKIRYLLIIKEANSCSLCFTPDVQKQNLKPYADQKFDDYNYKSFNAYEAEIVKAYLTHANKTPQDIYKEDVDKFMKAKSYKTKWNTPLELEKDSKICCNCAKRVTTVLLHKRIVHNKASNKIIGKLNKRSRCKYGKECHTQTNIHHTSKYQHWFMKNIANDPVKPLPEASLADNDEPNDGDDYYSEDIQDTDDEQEDDDMETDGEEDSMEIDY